MEKGIVSEGGDLLQGKILLVDDQKFNRMIMEKIITKQAPDYVFYEAENGDEAVRILKTVEIDLVILDLMMPVVDGFTVLEKLKSDPQICDMPVFVYTSLSDILSIERTLKMGAMDYFFKPLSQLEVQITVPLKVKNAVEKHKLYKQGHRDRAIINRFWSQLLKPERCNLPFEIEMETLSENILFDCVQRGEQCLIVFGQLAYSGAAIDIVPFLKGAFRLSLEKNMALNTLYETLMGFVELFMNKRDGEFAVVSLTKEAMQCMGTKETLLLKNSKRFGWEMLMGDGKPMTLSTGDQLVFLTKQTLENKYDQLLEKNKKDICWLHFLTEIPQNTSVSVHEIKESLNIYTTKNEKYPMDIIIINGFSG